MFSVTLDFSVRCSDGILDADLNVLLHAVPHVGSEVQPFEDEDPAIVRKVTFYSDRSITVWLEELKYESSKMKDVKEQLSEIGCTIY